MFSGLIRELEAKVFVYLGLGRRGGILDQPYRLCARLDRAWRKAGLDRARYVEREISAGQELSDRAVRVVLETRDQYPSLNQAIHSIEAKLGVTAKTVQSLSLRLPAGFQLSGGDLQETKVY